MMAVSRRYKLLALWFGAFVLVAAVVAGAGLLVLSMDSGLGTVNDLEVANGGNATRNVTIEAVPANATLRPFARNVTLAPNESVAYGTPLADGEEYALTIAVEDGPTESRNVTGPDGACGIRVVVEERVSVNTICA